MSWGFRNTESYKISKKEETFFDIRTWLGKKETLKAFTKEDLFVTVPKKDIKKVKVFLEYTGPIKAPILKNQEVAKLKVVNNNEVIKEISLYSTEDIKKINFFKSVFTSLNYMIWGDV